MRVRFEEAAVATGLRKASDREGTLRIVTIEGLDRSACGGTHVRATGEIGPITIRKVERVKQLVRLEFLCGGRAAPPRASRRRPPDRAGRGALGHRPRSCPRCSKPSAPSSRPPPRPAGAGGRAWPASRTRALCVGHAPTRAGGARSRSCASRTDRSNGSAALAQAYGALAGRRVRRRGRAAARRLVVAAAADAGIDAGRVLKAALEAHGGRGGGSARLAQGTVQQAGGLEAVVAAVLARVSLQQEARAVREVDATYW